MRFLIAALALILAVCLAANAAYAAPGQLFKNGAFRLSENIRVVNVTEDRGGNARNSFASPVQVEAPSKETFDSIAEEAERSSACASFLESYTDFLAGDPSGSSRRVYFTAISNRYDGLATYASGQLYYDPYSGLLTGEGRQYLNSYTDYPYPAVPTCPFGPESNRVLGISIDMSNGMAVVSQKVMTPQDKKAAPKEPEVLEEKAWTIALKCENGVLYGFGDASPQEMFVISLRKAET